MHAKIQQRKRIFSCCSVVHGRHGERMGPTDDTQVPSQTLRQHQRFHHLRLSRRRFVQGSHRTDAVGWGGEFPDYDVTDAKTPKKPIALMCATQTTAIASLDKARAEGATIRIEMPHIAKSVKSLKTKKPEKTSGNS